jgi:periplasmic copper chaperone A
MRLRHFGLCLGAAMGAFGLNAATVGAHLDPKTPEAPAGSNYTLEFEVEHGCEDSPTTKVAIQLPAGVVDAVAVPPAGWNGALDGDVVTFVGGPQPADQPMVIAIAMKLPNTPGEKLKFPAVQSCEVGVTRWIGDEASDTPAPFVQIVEATSAPDTAVPTTASPATTVTPTTVAPTTEIATTVAPTTAAPATTVSEPAEPTPASSVAPVASKDERQYNGWALPLVGLGGVAALGGVWMVSRRRH